MKSKILLFLCVIFVFENIFAQATDVYDFFKNSTSKYHCKGHPKAKGLEFSIKYPTSWEQKEGNRPNIVQKFGAVTPDDLSIGFLVLIKQDLTVDNYTKKDIEDFRDKNTVSELLPKGSTLISSNTNLIIDGQPAVCMEYSAERNVQQTTTEVHIYITSLTYHILYKNYLIMVQFDVGGTKQQIASIKKFYESQKKLFQLLAGSLVLHSKWK